MTFVNQKKFSTAVTNNYYASQWLSSSYQKMSVTRSSLKWFEPTNLIPPNFGLRRLKPTRFSTIKVHYILIRSVRWDPEVWWFFLLLKIIDRYNTPVYQVDSTLIYTWYIIYTIYIIYIFIKYYLIYYIIYI